MKKIFFPILFFVLGAVSLNAQTNIIDEVIWLVGDEAILKSEVEEQRLRAQYEGTPVQGNPYCVIPEQIAIQKLFLHQAALDSITVSESTVASQVESRLNYFMSQIGSREKMEEYFGKSVNLLREDLREVVRNQLIIEQMQQQLVGSITSRPADVRRFYNSLSADSIPVVPAQVELQVISFEPPVPTEEINRVKERLRDFTERVHKGEAEFSVLARVYSEDKESAARGGELGFRGRGELVPQYVSVAFNLQDPTKVSRIVESEFGFHIIQLIEKRGDRINSRHILLKPHISSEDKQKATHTLDSISNLIRESKITFEQGVMYYSQDKNSVMNAGLMLNEKTGTSKFEYQDLPSEIAKVVYGMNIGEISHPFGMIDPKTNKEVVAVVKLKSKTENHKANLTDDYQLLKNSYEGNKKEEFITNWIRKKQKETYISIDPKWSDCEFEYPGWKK
ncbi:MAG: peptidylprolyl isomerase [Prevotellaceae bacterium]|nr:peptidylprolyl isomerase [Prevotellaceae bacterium]